MRRVRRQQEQVATAGDRGTERHFVRRRREPDAIVEFDAGRHEHGGMYSPSMANAMTPDWKMSP